MPRHHQHVFASPNVSWPFSDSVRTVLCSFHAVQGFIDSLEHPPQLCKRESLQSLPLVGIDDVALRLVLFHFAHLFASLAPPKILPFGNEKTKTSCFLFHFAHLFVSLTFVEDTSVRKWKNKNFVFSFSFRSLIRSFDIRRRYSRSEMKSKNLFFCFAFHSLIRIFASD